MTTNPLPGWLTLYRWSCKYGYGDGTYALATSDALNCPRTDEKWNSFISLAPCPTGRDNCWLQSLREFLQPRAIYIWLHKHTIKYIIIILCIRLPVVVIIIIYSNFQVFYASKSSIVFLFHVPLKKSNDSIVALTIFGSCGTTPSASPNSAPSNFDRLPATFNDSCNNIYIYTLNVN